MIRVQRASVATGKHNVFCIERTTCFPIHYQHLSGTLRPALGGERSEQIMMPIRKRLLFVDDERGIRETLSLILLRYGFTVALAGTVTEAIQKIENQEFDLLLCDLNIEREGDGMDVVRAIRKVNPSCVVFILTAYPALDTAIEGIDLGVDGYLTKPADADALIASLAEKLISKHLKPIGAPIHKRSQTEADPPSTSETTDPTERPN